MGNQNPTVPAHCGSSRADSLAGKSEVLDVYKIDHTQLNPGCSSARMSLKNIARPERFELPTLWFDDSGKALLKSLESRELYLFLVEPLAVSLLVLVEFSSRSRWLQLRNPLQRRESLGSSTRPHAPFTNHVKACGTLNDKSRSQQTRV
jgi:hypothetical protein